MDKDIYSVGDVLTASVFRLANPSTTDVSIEWKMWLETALGNFPIVNLGADGAVVLPGGFDHDYGPVPLFTLAPGTPAGAYGIHCRILDPVTGQTRYVDENRFLIE